MYASFSKGQGHQGIFSSVKGTLSGNCKFLLEHFKGTKAMPRGHKGNRLCYLGEVHVSGLTTHGEISMRVHCDAIYAHSRLCKIQLSPVVNPINFALQVCHILMAFMILPPFLTKITEGMPGSRTKVIRHSIFLVLFCG